MENKKEFSHYAQFEHYVFDNRVLVPIGTGAEGTCYLAPKEQNVYKKFYRRNTIFPYYKVSDILTTKDIQIDSFVFPEVLFCHRKYLYGYLARYISDDLFYLGHRSNYKKMYPIDFEQMRRAYEWVRKDIERLSNANILMDDLFTNLLFDGQKFYMIDTCGYQVVNFNTWHENIFLFDETLKSILELWGKAGEDIFVPRGLEVDSYLKEYDLELKRRRI